MKGFGENMEMQRKDVVPCNTSLLILSLSSRNAIVDQFFHLPVPRSILHLQEITEGMPRTK